MASSHNDLFFPVIKHFSVAQYQLYPGETGTGFEYDVKPGVNIVLGVNGLGKTTLLNLLMKMVAGTSQIQAFGGLGMGAREETATNVRYFSSRVKDAAVRATATATIGFGEHRLTVTRKLSNLHITALKIDDILIDNRTHDSFEDIFKSTIKEMSGVKQFYDYLLLIHFVFFFLEDRQALIWDADAQAEILRVLYYDPNQQVAYRNFYNQISQLDSEIRNTQAVVNRHKKKIGVELIKRADDTALREIISLRKTKEELKKAISETEAKADDLNSTRLQYRNQLEQLKVARESKIKYARSANENFLRNEFSKSETTALYAVASVICDRGCIMCGSRSKRARQLVQEKLNAHKCPLCESQGAEREISEINRDEDGLISNARKLDDEVEQANHDVHSLEVELISHISAYNECMQILVLQRRQHEEIRLELQLAESGMPNNDEEFKSLQENLLGFQKIVDDANEEKSDYEGSLSTIIDDGETKVAAVAEAIISRFKMYITGFMAEDCTLDYEVREKRIGQGPSTTNFRFPVFTVRLTSGVFNDQASTRLSHRDVSESQREFIDLAFRMSLIAEITAKSAAMLVVETPEASLDSVFVPRAGTMIRNFLAGEKNHSNYLIASTNLNREAMIPALFGVIPSVDAISLAKAGKQKEFTQRLNEAVARGDRESRLVNLLNIAAQNAALEKYGPEYHDEYKRSVFPVWEDFNLAKDIAE